MGVIKDITDLVTRLINSVQDRKFAAELLEIQRMIGSLQSEQADLHEQRIALMTENAQLKQKIVALEQRVAQSQQRGTKPDDQLDEIAVEMLVFIANTTDDITEEDVIEHLRLPQAKGKYHFDQLLKREFVRTTRGQTGVGWFYDATPEGRDYLAKAGLL